MTKPLDFQLQKTNNVTKICKQNFKVTSQRETDSRELSQTSKQSSRDREICKRRTRRPEEKLPLKKPSQEKLNKEKETLKTEPEKEIELGKKSMLTMNRLVTPTLELVNTTMKC